VEIKRKKGYLTPVGSLKSVKTKRLKQQKSINKAVSLRYLPMAIP
jgi:hypothetical protein